MNLFSLLQSNFNRNNHQHVCINHDAVMDEPTSNLTEAPLMSSILTDVAINVPTLTLRGVPPV